MSLYLFAGLFLIGTLFFSGMQTAFRYANRIFIEIEKHKTGLVSFALTKTTQNPVHFVVTMFLGETLSLFFFVLCVYHLLLPFSSPLMTWGITLLVLLGLLVLRVLISKNTYKIYAHSLIKFFSIPALLIYWIFYPLAEIIIKSSYLLSDIWFKKRIQPFYNGFSSDISEYITEQIESAGNREEVEAEIRIFQNALSFPDIKAREVMTPRTEITAIDEESSVEELQKLFAETGYSKILVYKNNIDTIVGYVHSFEMFKNPTHIHSIMKSPLYVPESIPAGAVLKKLNKARKSIAIVIDEFGGTAGMLTTEDIIEELFGEIEDEHDSDEMIEQVLAENRYRFSARLEVDYINQNYQLNLPEEDSYETLGGLVFHYAEEIPKKGDVVSIAGYQIKILHVSDRRIEEIELTIL